MNRESFRKIIKECWDEVREELNPRATLKESLRGVVQEVLNEIATTTGKPELDKDEKETVDKQYNKKNNERVDVTNDKQRDELETIVHGINPSWQAYWDDHNQLVVRAQNLLYMRITQNYENNYNVDAMVKLVDRIRAIGLTWDQVKKFVKANFSDLKNKTIPYKLHDKSIDNYEDREVIKKSAGPDNDVVKTRFGTKKNGEDAKLGTTANKNQDYKKDDVKRDEDHQDQPMKQVTEPGKDPDGKNKNIEKTKQVKPPKHDKSPMNLRPKDAYNKTDKFRKRK